MFINFWYAAATSADLGENLITEYGADRWRATVLHPGTWNNI